MTQVTLSYFDLAASRGEECRLALILAGVDFVDDRISQKDWPARKERTPFGAVPVLTVEGQGELAQSNAILNYIGSKYDLRPSDPFQAAWHDSVMESVEEARIKIWTALRQGSTEEEKKLVRKELVEGPITTWAGQVERQIRGPFLCGEKIQVADVKLWSLVQWLTSGVIDFVPVDVLAPYKKLLGVHENVAAVPKVVAFRALHKK